MVKSYSVLTPDVKPLHPNLCEDTDVPIEEVVVSPFEL